MPYSERRESILALIARSRRIAVSGLAKELGLSEVTIRKYLDQLEGEGLVLRTRGGAVMAEDRAVLRTVAMRERSSSVQKAAIAAAARRLVAAGDVVYLDAGSSCRALAVELREAAAGELAGLQVLTPSLDVLLELDSSEGVSLHCPGGSWRRESRSFIGPAAAAFLEDWRVDACFLGAVGFDGEGRFYTQNLAEAQLKRQAAKVSRRRIVLADSGKWGVEAFSVFARPGSVDVLVTDSGFTGAALLEGIGIEVIVAA